MTDRSSDYISIEEISACRGAPMIRLDNGLGHCAACGEWSTCAEDVDDD